MTGQQSSPVCEQAGAMVSGEGIRKDDKLLILASSSPRRQELIRFLQLPYHIRVSDVDESVPPEWEPKQIVEELSLRKARAVVEMFPDVQEGIVVGSDTIVVLDGQVLGKPKDEEEAKATLAMLQGRAHQVYSGIACVDAASGRQQAAHRMTEVRMKKLQPEQIARYVATGEPMDKAGSYGIQGLGATLIEEIKGDYFTVVGLPLSLLADLLREWGVDVL